MIKKTHIALGTLSLLPLITHIPLLYLGIGLIGSIFPDYDKKLHIKHRGITHTLLALILTTATISIFNINLALAWSIAYLSHLIGDCVTVMGIPAFYPFSDKYFGLKLFKTNSIWDYIVFFISICSSLYIISNIKNYNLIKLF